MKKQWASIISSAILAASAGAVFAASFDGGTEVAVNVQPTRGAVQAVRNALTKEQRMEVFNVLTVHDIDRWVLGQKAITADWIKSNFSANSDIARFSRGASKNLASHGGSFSLFADYLRGGHVFYDLNFQPFDPMYNNGAPGASGKSVGFTVLFAEDGSVIGNDVEVTRLPTTGVITIYSIYTFGKMPVASFIP